MKKKRNNTILLMIADQMILNHAIRKNENILQVANECGITLANIENKVADEQCTK